MKSSLLMILFVSLLNAESTSFNKPLSLDEAIEIVKAQNLEVKAADYDVKSAMEETGMASGMHWGRLDFVQKVARSDDAGNAFGFKLASREANFGDFGLAEADFTNPNLLSVEPRDLNYPEDQNFFQSKLVYQVPIYTGGQISGYTEISRSMEKMKQLDKADVLNEKIYQTRKSYYDMALLDRSLNNLALILSNISTLESMIETMITEGYAKEVDLLEIKAKKANVVRLVNQMKSNQELLYHFLSFLLNQEVKAIALPESDIACPMIDDEEVLQHNLDIQKAETGLKIHDKMVDVSYAGYLPEVGAFAEVSTADDTFLGDATDHKSYTVGAQLTWNLFGGGTDASKIEKARVQELKMKTQVDLAKKGIALKLAHIRTEIKSFDEEIKSLESELELANKIYESYETRYRENLASMNDVIIQQSRQIEKILELQVVKNKRIERVFALEKLANGVNQ